MSLLADALASQYPTAIGFIIKQAPPRDRPDQCSDEAVEAAFRDAELLEELEAAFGQFNIFAALNIQRSENRHSDMLAFLLDPSSPHGLGVRPLRSFLLSLTHGSLASQTGATPSGIVRLDYRDVLLRREIVITDRKRPDIHIAFTNSKLVVLIENKIDAAEGKDQLASYANWADKEYPEINGWRKLLVYLTPLGIRATCEGWIAVSYRSFVELIDNLLQLPGHGIGEDIAFTLRQYKHVLVTEIVPDMHPMLKKADKFYRDHGPVIDYLRAARGDRNPVSPTVEALRDLIKRLIEGNSDLKYIGPISQGRFTLQRWLNWKPQPWLALSIDQGRDLLWTGEVEGNELLRLELTIADSKPEQRKGKRFLNERVLQLSQQYDEVGLEDAVRTAWDAFVNKTLPKLMGVRV